MEVINEKSSCGGCRNINRFLHLPAYWLQFDSHPPAQSGYDSQEYVPNEVLVKFKEDVVWDFPQYKWQIQNIIDFLQGKIITYHKLDISPSTWEPSVIAQRSFIGDPYLLHVRVPMQIGTDYAISFLKSLPYVEWAEKNGKACLDNTTPNDLRFGEQWALQNIQAPHAWDIFTGSPDVVVAVLDSGIDVNHLDLAANLWNNPNDPPGGGDNDHNGYADDEHGWNFCANPENVDVHDDNSDGNVWHGTSVSGIIGAVGNNEVGISGVCWTVKIMAIKTHNASLGNVDLATMARAIDYATYNGAFLINASWHTTQDSQTLKSAIQRAMKRNRLFVCASGNCPQCNGWNIDDPALPTGQHSYPSNWTLDNIISVLATGTANGSDFKIPESHYGPISVDIGAPGNGVLTTKGSPYFYLTLYGTSAAAPHVSGVAALALGICPGLTSSRLKSMILNGADYASSLQVTCFSNGRLNAFNVLNAIGGYTPPNAPSNLTAGPTAWNVIALNWHDNSNNEAGFEIQKKDQYQTVFVHDNCADNNATSTVAFQDETIDPLL